MESCYTKSKHGTRQLFYSKHEERAKLKFHSLNYIHKIKRLHMLLLEIPTITIVFRNTTKMNAILKCREQMFH